jgi:hypothetical protein
MQAIGSKINQRRLKAETFYSAWAYGERAKRKNAKILYQSE